VALDPSDPQATHDVVFTTSYTLYYLGTAVEAGDRVCWERSNRFVVTSVQDTTRLVDDVECEWYAGQQGWTYELIASSEVEPRGCFQSLGFSTYGAKYLFNPSTTSAVQCEDGSAANCKLRDAPCEARVSCNTVALTNYNAEFPNLAYADVQIITAGADDTPAGELKMCLAKAADTSTFTKQDGVVLNVLHEPPSAPPSPSSPSPPDSPDSPLVSRLRSPCRDFWVNWKADHCTWVGDGGADGPAGHGYNCADALPGYDLNANSGATKCGDLAPTTCLEPTSPYYGTNGCDGTIGEYCERSCGCCASPWECGDDENGATTAGYGLQTTCHSSQTHICGCDYMLAVGILNFNFDCDAQYDTTLGTTSFVEMFCAASAPHDCCAVQVESPITPPLPPPLPPPPSPPPLPPCGDTGGFTDASCQGFLANGHCNCNNLIGINCAGTCGCCPSPPPAPPSAPPPSLPPMAPVTYCTAAEASAGGYPSSEGCQAWYEQMLPHHSGLVYGGGGLMAYGVCYYEPAQNKIWFRATTHVSKCDEAPARRCICEYRPPSIPPSVPPPTSPPPQVPTPDSPPPSPPDYWLFSGRHTWGNNAAGTKCYEPDLVSLTSRGSDQATFTLEEAQRVCGTLPNCMCASNHSNHPCVPISLLAPPSAQVRVRLRLRRPDDRPRAPPRLHEGQHPGRPAGVWLHSHDGATAAVAHHPAQQRVVLHHQRRRGVRKLRALDVPYGHRAARARRLRGRRALPDAALRVDLPNARRRGDGLPDAAALGDRVRRPARDEQLGQHWRVARPLLCARRPDERVQLLPLLLRKEP